MDRNDLAGFLRTMRERLRPQDVGLPAGTASRTPGRRREEVARLAHISVEYYARLEQARGSSPSRRVLTELEGLAPQPWMKAVYRFQSHDEPHTFPAWRLRAGNQR